MAKVLQNSTGALVYCYHDESGMWAMPEVIKVSILDPNKNIIVANETPTYLGYGLYQWVLLKELTSSPGRYEAHWYTKKYLSEIIDIEYFDVVKVENEYLVTVEDIIEYTGQELNKDFIRQIIFAFQNILESYCNRQFKPTGVVNEVYSGDGSRILLLNNYPLLDVSKVGIVQPDGTIMYIPERDVIHDKSEGFIADFDKGTVELTSRYSFIKGTKNILVSYIYGFDEIPDDLKLIAKEWISFKLEHKDSIGIDSESLGPYRVSFSKEYLPQHCKQVMDTYKRKY